MSIPKNHRLNKSSLFQVIFKKGDKKVTPYFVVYKLEANSGVPISTGCVLPSFGIIASKKVGGAVKRNRAKRLMREAIKLNWDIVKNDKSIYVFVCRGKILDTNIEKISNAVKNLF